MRHAWKAKERPCRVYWGTHGCRKQRGHLGKHLCQPGCGHAPTDPGVLYGEDAPNWSENPRIVSDQQGCAK